MNVVNLKGKRTSSQLKHIKKKSRNSQQTMVAVDPNDGAAQFHKDKSDLCSPNRRACHINSAAHLSARWARCTVCMRKQCDKLGERRSIKYVHNYVEQKVSKAVTSGEPDAGAVYS